MKSRILLAAAIATLSGGPTVSADPAAGQVCLTAQGAVEPTATQGWQQALANSDPRAVQFMTGRWYNETRNTYTGQISKMVYTYEATQGLTYDNEVCDGNGQGCHRYQGYGMYAVQWQGEGALLLFTNISDMSRNSFCSMGTLRFMDENRAVGPDGQTVMQRM